MNDQRASRGKLRFDGKLWRRPMTAEPFPVGGSCNRRPPLSTKISHILQKEFPARPDGAECGKLTGFNPKPQCASAAPTLKRRTRWLGSQRSRVPSRWGLTIVRPQPPFFTTLTRQSNSVDGSFHYKPEALFSYFASACGSPLISIPGSGDYIHNSPAIERSLTGRIETGHSLFRETW